MVRAGSSVQFTPAAPQSSLKSLPLSIRRMVLGWETCAECAGEKGRNRESRNGGMCAERAGKMGEIGEAERGGECARNARESGDGEVGGGGGGGGKLTDSHGGFCVSADEMADAAKAHPLSRVGIHQAAPKPACVRCPMAREVIPCALMTRVRPQNSLPFPTDRLPWPAECK